MARDARTGHAAAQLHDDFPSDERGWISGRRTGPGRFIVGAQPASRWGEALGFLAEMRVPSWWKWLGGAYLLVAVSTLAAVLLRKREHRSVPLADPYRPDPDPPSQPTIIFLACRYSLTISVVAIAPLLVAMAIGHRQIVPSFEWPIAVAVAPTADQGEALLKETRSCISTPGAARDPKWCLTRCTSGARPDGASKSSLEGIGSKSVAAR